MLKFPPLNSVTFRKSDSENIVYTCTHVNGKMITFKTTSGMGGGEKKGE
jgi:hypothetical protein